MIIDKLMCYAMISATIGIILTLINLFLIVLGIIPSLTIAWLIVLIPLIIGLILELITLLILTFNTKC